MTYGLPLLGVLPVFMGMHDLFHTLFHPSEHGNIIEYITLKMCRALRRGAPSHLHAVGPANLLVVILFWTLGGAAVVRSAGSAGNHHTHRVVSISHYLLLPGARREICAPALYYVARTAEDVAVFGR